MKSREISRSKIGPFSLACTDPYIGIGWEYQSKKISHVWVMFLRLIINTSSYWVRDLKSLVGHIIQDHH